jgi:hypothetical protein
MLAIPIISLVETVMGELTLCAPSQIQFSGPNAIIDASASELL